MPPATRENGLFIGGGWRGVVGAHVIQNCAAQRRNDTHMRSQLYVPEMTRRYLKSEILSYVQIYFQKLLPVFKDIESEADKLANDFYDNFMNQPVHDEYIDPSSIADQAMEMGIEYYFYLTLGKYNLTATWHATLYQLWEQQSRLFLFREMSHVYKLEFKTFCTTLAEIKKKFSFHNVDIEAFACWSKINELFFCATSLSMVPVIQQKNCEKSIQHCSEKRPHCSEQRRISII
jgi:hypothetical protein